MKVELRIYTDDSDHETIEHEVPNFWPVPQPGTYITLNNTNVLAVLTSTYEYDSNLAVQRIVITTERC